MNIVVNPDLQAYIDPLTPEENEALERSLLAEGCRDALVLWGEMLVDGHNRYRLCQLHGLPFRTVQHPSFRSIEDVHLWMIDQHLGRRSLSNYQRGVLALRKSEILADRRAVAGVAAARAAAAPAAEGPADDTPPVVPAERLSGRDAIAKAARLSPSQVQMIEKIHKQAAPEVVAAVRAGSLSISAAAAVAALPAEEQTAAAAAGADELKSVARRAREGKRKPREAAPATAAPSVDPAAAAPAGAIDSTRPPWETEATHAGDAATLAALRQQVAELTAENQVLRQELAALRAAAA